MTLRDIAAEVILGTVRFYKELALEQRNCRCRLHTGGLRLCQFVAAWY